MNNKKNKKNIHQKSEAQIKFLDDLSKKRQRLYELQKRATDLSKNECLELAKTSMYLIKVDIGHKFYKKHKVKWTGFQKTAKMKPNAKPTVNQIAMSKSKAKAKERAKERNEQLSLFDK